ncbi:SWIM zinc finger family protein [Candidatus Thiothrix sp. Deng01]|uniref:SWIM zinc finger family protein n=1 Tax=Candidatus Thiothrix phosphatis TaxID=3112415 RepID=A0ABU6CYI2_9GAMM|nr:SWIM zinc finger family protein [Candidatus Thiothrix sp. Deng01]MEB4591154.1 SWIM zinc finger family protein [Candidatus Thiothrix sp. Deng01]
MKLNNLETSVDHAILQRGQGYTAFVLDLEETEPEFWQAYVEGTETYDVEIQLDGDTVTDWSCSCPYDYGPVCKHVVATLLNIRARRQTSATGQATAASAPSKREQLDQTLKTIKREDLEAYIRQQLHGDRALLDKFLLRFQPVVSGGENIAKQYQQMFSHLARRHFQHGFIDYEEANNFVDEAQELLDTLQQSPLEPAGSIDAGFAIARSIADIANQIDDSDGGLGDLMYGVKAILAKPYRLLPAERQEQLFQQVLAASFDKQYSEYGLEGIFTELLETWTADNRAYQDAYLQVLDQQIRATPIGWGRDYLLRLQLKLLKAWGRQDELDTLTSAHLEIPDFRDTAVQQAIDTKDFAKARQLLLEGVRLAEQQSLPGILNRWRVRLLEIAYQLNEPPAIRSELEWLFQNNQFSLEYYRQLKAAYSPDEWPEVRQRLYAMIPAARGFDPARANLLEEENDLPALYALVTQPAPIPGQTHTLFKKYAQLLATAFPQEITVAYASQICDYLRNNTGRHAYEQTVNDLKILAKMPNGQNMANNLVADFRTRYKTRKAMLEMFTKVFKT